MTRFAVDASVAVKWFLTEDLSETARGLATLEHELVAPDIILAEVANVLWKRARSGDLTAGDGRTALRTIRALVAFQRSELLVPPAYEIAVAINRSVYDSLYVALALRDGCQLVTADRRLHEAAERDFGGTTVWLGSLADAAL